MSGVLWAAWSILWLVPAGTITFSISLASDAQEALVFAMHYACPARVRLSGTYICRARVLALPSWKSLGGTAICALEHHLWCSWLKNQSKRTWGQSRSL